MQQKTLLASKPWITVLLMVAVVSFFGCGTGSEISMTGGTTADQSAVLAAVETEPFFTESITDTDEDNEAAAEAQAQIYDGQVAIESLSSEAGTAELPRFWWRGDLERLGREIDIHIEDNVARVTVVHDVAGTFYIADTTGDALYLWGKPFEDMVTRHAEFLKTAKGWILTAISPVQFTLAESNIQTVAIEAVRAFSGDELVWEATDPSTLYTVTEGLPIFTHGDEIRVEATVSNSSGAGWEPDSFVFLHRPGPHISGRRNRDLMFDDGTNGDMVAGDGVFTRVYTVGPCRGRHFAAVDVIDSATFMEIEAPYNSVAWGMPYIVE
jgi:hypothetical protein